ncbi:MAG: FAD:protein FMN transferase [Planctomycetes bacterium]|nr:FAD:protein FMN transferase [Planctomycetota bacterium]
MKNQKIKFVLAVLTAILIFYLLLKQLENRRSARIESPNKIVMNTIAEIIAIGPDKKTAQLSVDAAFKKIYSLEKLMNRYDANSQLWQVNKLAAEEPVKIDKDLFDILQQSVYYSKITNGAFDITVGPLVDLWRKCAEANSVPTNQQFGQVKKIIGYDKLILDSNNFSVRFTTAGVSLDLGAIAKGFAADKAIEEMKKCGATGGLVDIGGQIGCFGLTEKSGKWLIGIRNPAKSESNQIIVKSALGCLTALALSDMAVSTSGNYERFYKIGDHQFSHIFNPATEKNADQLASVTIISSDGSCADALSTAVSVLGAQKGLELVEKIDDTEAILIPANNKNALIKSNGAEKFVAK